MLRICICVCEITTGIQVRITTLYVYRIGYCDFVTASKFQTFNAARVRIQSYEELAHISFERV